jgi:hypothetical protein
MRTTFDRVGEQRMRRRLCAGAKAALLGVLLSAAGCSGPAVPPTVLSPSPAVTGTPAPVSVESTVPVRVSIAPRARLRGNTLTVSGTADLIDESVIAWEVGRARSEDQWDTYRSGKAVVKGGRFSFKANVKSIPGRKLYAFLLFGTDGQPVQVRARYGEFGQNLRGSHQNFHGDYRTLEYWLGVSR